MEISITPGVRRDSIQTNGAAFQINSAKRFVPVVNLFNNNNIKDLENIKI